MHFTLVKNEAVLKCKFIIFFKGMPNNPELSLLKQGLCMPGSNKMHAHNLQSFRTHFTPHIVPYQNQ